MYFLMVTLGFMYYNGLTPGTARLLTKTSFSKIGMIFLT